MEQTSHPTETPSSQAPSMASTSRKGGHSRSASFNTSPASAGKALGDPAPSFGARLDNVPAPISTLQRNSGDFQTHGDPIDGTQRQPQMRQLTPTYGVDEDPQAPRNGGFCRPCNGGQSPPPPQMTRLPSLSTMVGGMSNTQRVTQAQPYRSNSRPANPYAHRADEVGLHHRLPGVGAIHDLLTPSNWRPGQEPISEVEAQELYDRARALAKQDADNFAKHIDDGPYQEERLEAFQKDWQAQRRVDEMILLEQRNIYKTFLQSKREQIEYSTGLRKQPKQETSYQELFQRPLAGGPPLSFHGSNPLYNGVQQTHQAASLWNRNDTQSPSMGAYHLHQHKQPMGRLHYPGSSPLSPSFLDPTLVPQSYEAALHYYQRNKILLNQYHLENEQYLATWSAKYNRQGPHGSLSSPYLAPNMAMGGRPIQPIHYAPVPAGHVQASQLPMVYDLASYPHIRSTPRPTPVPVPRPILGQIPGSMPGLMPGMFPRQVMPGPYPVDGNSTYGHTVNAGSRNGRMAGHGQSSLREVHNAGSPPKSTHRKRKSGEVTTHDTKGHNATTKGAPATRLPTSDLSRMQSPKKYRFVQAEARLGREKKSHKDADKVDAQLRDAISAAKLPMPTISDQALRAAGVAPKPKSAIQLSETTDFVSKPKARSRKGPFPAEGIRVSGPFGNALLAAGTKDTHQQLSTSASAIPSGIRSGRAPSPDDSNAESFPKAGHGSVDLTGGDANTASGQPRCPNKLIASTIGEGDRVHRPKRCLSEESSSSSVGSSNASPSSPDSFEDPYDGDYGKRTSIGGRTATATRKEPGTPRKTPIVPAKRGLSSTAAHGTAEKRSRRAL